MNSTVYVSQSVVLRTVEEVKDVVKVDDYKDDPDFRRINPAEPILGNLRFLINPGIETRLTFTPTGGTELIRQLEQALTQMQLIVTRSRLVQKDD